MYPVSVIIPTYNRDKFLGRALQSVLEQHEFKGEILIIDDGSTDNTQSVMAPFADHCSIRYVYTKNNGPAAARNLGVQLAEHDYIAFLDSDDHWHKEKLRKQMALLRKNQKYAISHTEEKWLRRGEHLNKKNIHKPRHGYIFDHCLRLCAVGMSTVIMKKQLFFATGGFDVSLPCCEDYDLWLRISHNHDFLLVPEPLTIKEGGRDDQVSSIHGIGMDRYRIYALEKLLDQSILSHNQRKTAMKVLEEKCKIFGNGCLKHGRITEGLFFLNLYQKYSKT